MIPLDIYDELPKYMRIYLLNYGWHFNKALYLYAFKKELLTKEYIDKILTQYNITLNNNIGYDYLFVANVCKRDYYGSSIQDEKHLALFIKDTIDGSGEVMRKWYATMVAKGYMIEWEDVV